VVLIVVVVVVAAAAFVLVRERILADCQRRGLLAPELQSGNWQDKKNHLGDAPVVVLVSLSIVVD